MSQTGDQRMTRADAERLLATGEGPAGLSALLAAAASPPTAAELQGSEQALAAFRSAHLAPVRAARSSRMKSALGKVAALKVAGAAAIATAATGGIALAAASGALPFQAQQHVPSVTDHSAATTPAGAAPADSSADAGSSGAPQPSNTPAGTPSPSLPGLCHAYQAGAMSHGNVANNPAFTALIRAAGGTDNVAAYCVTLIGPAPTHHGKPTDLPTHAAPPTGGPPAVLPTHPVVPVGPPTSRPTHPTAPPTGHRP